MTQMNLQSYAVWDRPTRLFHWTNFACVIALAAIGTAILYDKELGVTDGGKILLKTTHVWFGYVFAVNLAWRIAWAFIGNRHATWSAILPFHTDYGAAFKTYLRELIRGDVRPYLGHNPIARVMISIFFILLVLQAVTGLVLAGTDIYYPPFGDWIASWIAAPGVDPSTIAPYDKTGIDPASWEAMRSFRSPFVTVHYWNFYALLLAIIIHITGVIVTELREGGGIVSAMFTGRKTESRMTIWGKVPDKTRAAWTITVRPCLRANKTQRQVDEWLSPGQPFLKTANREQSHSKGWRIAARSAFGT